ncbi:helicase-associated domain-containing protein [Georgenia wangjunii]|uniref:helicase-associated domain-containing protein n=1 Tax=Georgenia wangjunii TaxID=3117730 RepID=UPI002F266437
MNPMQPGTATSEELARALAERTDDQLTLLLRERPDLGVPTPSSVTVLGGRAASRPSVERVLARLTTRDLQVVEALVALAPLGLTSAEDLGRAVGLPAAKARDVVDRAEELALTVGGRPVLALAEALGPHPAGLGPSLASLGAAVAGGTAAGGTPPRTADELSARMKDAPSAAARMLDALRWGPPVGVVSAGAPSPGARWLLDHGILHRLSATQLVLPLEVGLAARDGRTHAEPAVAPPTAGIATRPAHVVSSEGARLAEESVRLVALLLMAWQDAPAAVLRSGGLGVRELKRTATALETDPATAATIAEVAATADLVEAVDDGNDGLLFEPTAQSLQWRESTLGRRWAHLAAAWLASRRTAWLVGTRNDHGALRAALEPGLERGWAARLRRRALEALADLPEGAAPTAAELHAILTWHAPRATPPETSVAAVLGEAELLGLTGAGALTAAGRALLDAPGAGAASAGSGTVSLATAIGVAAAATALEAALPEPVEELVVQGDLTGIVPGRPGPALDELITLSADVESRGAALTVRFTPVSIRRALDAGVAGEDLVERLRAASRTPLPQALEYLVTDTARKHGQVRVGSAASYVRTQDAAAASALVSHPRLAGLRLRPIAPTVLVSSASPAELIEALRAADAAPALEGPDGTVVVGLPGTGGRTGGAGGARLRPASRARRPVAPPAPVELDVRTMDDAELAALVARMRAGQDRAAHAAANRASGDLAATDPVHTVALLHEAAQTGTPVSVIVIGPTGKPEKRRVRPVSIEGGRVRMVDLGREAEIIVAIHRISAVGPDSRA